jgi:hypothetical protein
MKRSQESPEGSGHSLHPLHASLVALNAVLKLRQTPGLSNPEQRIHLVLQHT